MDQEIWKPIPGYEGIYAVSNQGRVMRLLTRTNGKAGNILSPQRNTYGYRHVNLYKSGHHKCVVVHRLVMEAFVGKCPDGIQVNHKNGDKSDNRLENLEYVTPQENSIHAYQVLGRKPVHNRGEAAGGAKLTESQVLQIRSEYDGKHGSYSKLARKFGVDNKTVSSIINRKYWTHI